MRIKTIITFVKTQAYDSLHFYKKTKHKHQYRLVHRSLNIWNKP